MISIVTPSFRQLPWLKLCAASVADQREVESEHIVKNNETGPELVTWAETISSLSLIRVEPDTGMYDAVNTRIDPLSPGEICAYLNCDEQYLPGTLGTVAEFFFRANRGIEVLFGDAILLKPRLRADRLPQSHAP